MGESRIRDENYYQVSGWMINKLGLKGINLEIYAIIYGFTQDGETEFSGSVQYLCEFTNTSRPTVIKSLKTLVDAGYIIKHEEIINGIRCNKYKADLGVVKKLYWGSKETLLGGSKETLPNNNIPNNNISNNNNIKDIVEYLNKKAGTHYKPDSKETVKHIQARLNENYTLEDFKIVIDKKCAEWLNDPKMCQFLRPSTLFSPSKFEAYLNAPVKGGNKANGDNRGYPQGNNTETETRKLGTYI